MDLGKRIKELRNDRGLKAIFIAKRAGISLWYLSMIENGKRNPSLEKLQAIADAIGVDVAEFFLAQNVSDPLSNSVRLGGE